MLHRIKVGSQQLLWSPHSRLVPAHRAYTAAAGGRHRQQHLRRRSGDALAWVSVGEQFCLATHGTPEFVALVDRERLNQCYSSRKGKPET